MWMDSEEEGQVVCYQKCFARKLKHRVNVWLKIEDKLKEVEYGQRSMEKEAEFYIF
jgi:hypothetical protein